ncbi:MAG: hypothetical protein QOG04_26 [Actinomycetota bacterium]|jgi:hypothetical protein|nr:hypothetical protein [Actinomycetota bacterium]
MRKVLVAALAAALAMTLAGPSGAAGKMTRLGTDPENDGPPTLDITYLDVGRTGDALEIRIGVAHILPEIRGIPEAPGIEWVFDVGTRTFVAEAVPGQVPTFYLFELKGDSATQMDSPTGTYDHQDGFIRMLIPLADIGAKRGSLISGTGDRGTEDVDAHVHYGAGEVFPDKMATTRDFVVR